MKIGFRKPSLKKSFKAITTGKAKRKLKKALIPGYGKKGVGVIKNPKRTIYNKVYNKTTVGTKELLKNKKARKKKETSVSNINNSKESNIIINYYLAIYYRIFYSNITVLFNIFIL